MLGFVLKKNLIFLSLNFLFFYFCDMEDKRNEQRKQWWASHKGECEVTPSMKRRKAGHDYSAPCIYMLTLVVKERRKILGTLHDADNNHSLPWVEPSVLGHKVLACWREITTYYPEVELYNVQLMPDHLHGIIHVRRKLPKHLGVLVNGFKKGCNDVSREMGLGTLWEDGYQDSILTHDGQLKNMKNYINNNPLRLWTKLHNREFFVVRRDVRIGKEKVAVAGNQYLLEHPDKEVVRCSRSLTEKEIEERVNALIKRAMEGAVLVSPCISPGEKAVMRAAYEIGARMIVLLENGFSPMWKPSGKQFDACLAGNLLLVAPWPHHNDRRAITREQCMQLNDLARRIVEGEG